MLGDPFNHTECRCLVWLFQNTFRFLVVGQSLAISAQKAHPIRWTNKHLDLDLTGMYLLSSCGRNPHAVVNRHLRWILAGEEDPFVQKLLELKNLPNPVSMWQPTVTLSLTTSDRVISCTIWMLINVTNGWFERGGGGVQHKSKGVAKDFHRKRGG